MFAPQAGHSWVLGSLWDLGQVTQPFLVSFLVWEVRAQAGSSSSAWPMPHFRPLLRRCRYRCGSPGSLAWMLFAPQSEPKRTCRGNESIKWANLLSDGMVHLRLGRTHLNAALTLLELPPPIFLEFMYLFEGERVCACKREQEEWGAAAEAEGDADSLLSREPNAGFYLRTLGSRPRLKADARPTEPPRRPVAPLLGG